MTAIDATNLNLRKNAQAYQTDRLGMPSHIASAIRQASSSTGVDFSYLVQKASQESSFNSNAQASSSSATGLFQFTKNTWLHMIKDHGADYGLQAYSDKITTDKNGHLQVTDKTARQAILDLRKDPTISALMAGEYDKENLASLKSSIGGKIGPTELYMAHFLGASGAGDFISTLRDSPTTSAASILPNAADANPTVFYNKDGSEKTVAQVYQQFAKKFDQGQAVYVANNGAKSLPAMEVKAVNVATMSTTSYALESYKSANSVASSNNLNRLASSSMPDTKDSASSLFATMVLAQMDMGKISALSTEKTHKDSNAA